MKSKQGVPSTAAPASVYVAAAQLTKLTVLTTAVTDHIVPSIRRLLTLPQHCHLAGLSLFWRLFGLQLALFTAPDPVHLACLEQLLG